MSEPPTPAPDQREHEPRWPAVIAVLAVGGLSLALPGSLIVGPRWLFPATVGTLLIPTVISHQVGQQALNKIFGFAVSAVVTTGMIVAIVLLIKALPSHKETPEALLLSATSLWFTNVLVFTLWYWRLDAGGPHRRDERPGHSEGAFLFPQMTMAPREKADVGQQLWSPDFFDYLFLAFNTSTAFSPTDTPVLERWGKLLMMVQSIISLTVLAILAARAVNTL